MLRDALYKKLDRLTGLQNLGLGIGEDAIFFNGQSPKVALPPAKWLSGKIIIFFPLGKSSFSGRPFTPSPRLGAALPL